MEPNQQNNGQGVQQNVSISQAELGYQLPRMPQMQNILGPQVNTFVQGYNVVPQAQGAVVTNLQPGFLSFGNTNAGSGPLPSMGSFIAGLNQPSPVGIVQNVNKSGADNWISSSQNNNSLPSFGHFLLPQQYQQQTGTQSFIGNQPSPHQQIFPSNQQSPQQVFSPNQHSTQFFPTNQMSPQQQMFSTNQHSPQQVFVNNQASAQFFQQQSQQFFGSTLPQQQLYTGQPGSHQIYTQHATQQMFGQYPNRLPTGQIIGSDMIPQVMAAPRINLNTNYIAGVNNIMGVSASQMLPPINQLMQSSTGQVLPSIGNILQGQALPSFNNFISPYGGQINIDNSAQNQAMLPTSMASSQVTSSVVTTTSSPHLINIYGDQKVMQTSQKPVHHVSSNQYTVTRPTVTTTTSHSSPSKKTKTHNPAVHVTRDMTRSNLIDDSRTVVVPFGWSRMVVDNSIIYYSPTNVPLKSPLEIAKYLTSDGTCKCGLECPVYINKVFNFDVGILSRMWSLDIDCPKDLTKLCNHKRKMIAMATLHTSFSMTTSHIPETVSVNSVSGGIPSLSTPMKTDKKSRPRVKPSIPTSTEGILVSSLMAEHEKQMAERLSTNQKSDNIRSDISSTNQKSDNIRSDTSSTIQKPDNLQPITSTVSDQLSSATKPEMSIVSDVSNQTAEPTSEASKSVQEIHAITKSDDVCSITKLSSSATIEMSTKHISSSSQMPPKPESDSISSNVSNNLASSIPSSKTSDDKINRDSINAVEEVENNIKNADEPMDMTKKTELEGQVKVEVQGHVDMQPMEVETDKSGSDMDVQVCLERKLQTENKQDEIPTSCENDVALERECEVKLVENVSESTTKEDDSKPGLEDADSSNHSELKQLEKNSKQEKDMEDCTGNEDGALKEKSNENIEVVQKTCETEESKNHMEVETTNKQNGSETLNNDNIIENMETNQSRDEKPMECTDSSQSDKHEKAVIDNSQPTDQTKNSVKSSVEPMTMESKDLTSKLSQVDKTDHSDEALELHSQSSGASKLHLESNRNTELNTSSQPENSNITVTCGQNLLQLSTMASVSLTTASKITTSNSANCSQIISNVTTAAKSVCTASVSVTSSISSTGSIPSTKSEHKFDNKDLKISIDNTMVTSIISSINAVRSHDHSDKKKSPKSPKQIKGTHGSQKSPKPPASYDSFPVFNLPQLRYPLGHGILPSQGAESQINPFGIDPFTGQLLPPEMFNFHPYSLLNEKLMNQKKTRKSPKSKEKDIKEKDTSVKVKVNNVYNSETPPPNVDVSQLKDHGKGPIPKVPVSSTASFLDDPSGFLAEQSILISSSLSNNLSSPLKDSHKSGTKERLDTVDGDVKSASVSSTTLGDSAKVSKADILLASISSSSAAHGMVVNSNAGTSLNSKLLSLATNVSEPQSILGCAESEMFTEDRCESLSPDSGNECPSASETKTPSSVVHHTATKTVKKKESQIDDLTLMQNNKILDILSNAKKGLLPLSTAGPSKKKISPSKPLSSSTCKTFPNRSAIQQVLSNTKSNEFPASTLLSAAARAQKANQTFTFPAISQSIPHPTSFFNPLKLDISDTVVQGTGSQNTNVALSSSSKIPAGTKSCASKSDIASVHKSMAKLLQQPVNLSIGNTFSKGCEIPMTKSSGISDKPISVSKCISKPVETVTSSTAQTTHHLTTSNLQSPFQNILPNISAMPQNIGQPLLNVAASNLHLNLPNSQVVSESNAITTQNGIQYIPVQGQNFVNIDNNNIGQQLINKGNQGQLDAHVLKPIESIADAMNSGKLQVPTMDQLLQQQALTSNGQMLVMPPNLHVPLLQYLGSNSVAIGQDKAAMPQLNNLFDLSMLNNQQGQLHVNLANMGQPNPINLQQQLWNNSGNLTAMQIHTLQLQQQLLQQIQQLQDMQSLISQFSVQGNNVPMATVVNKDNTMTTKEAPIPGKATPETMVSIVSTTCQESPTHEGDEEEEGGDEEEPGSSEDKGTSTDFDEGEENVDFINPGDESMDPTRGDVADTTSCISTSYDNDLDGHVKGQSSLQVNEGDSNDNKSLGANDEFQLGGNLTDNLCHINNEPVNLKSRKYTSCAVSCTSSSNIDSPVSDIMPSTSTSLKKGGVSRQTRNMQRRAGKLQGTYHGLPQKRKLEGADSEDVVSESFVDLPYFDIGDLVWGQIRGFPSWPGKVVHESEVYDAEELERGKCWVKWFGDHTFTQVDMSKLKTLTEGLEGHQKSKKKNKKGRKMNSNLEAAIHEALIELDRQTSLQLEESKVKMIKSQ